MATTTTTPPETSSPQLLADRRGDQLLVWAVTFFALAVLVHNSDHARRGVDSIGRDVFVAGTSAIILEVGIAILGYQRHRWAPIGAVVTGFSLATGYLFVHFLPQRSWLSDSFLSAHNVSPLSWGAASLETSAAFILGVVGLIVLRRRGGLASTARPNLEQRSVRVAATRPVVLAMIVGNALILGISIAQL